MPDNVLQDAGNIQTSAAAAPETDSTVVNNVDTETGNPSNSAPVDEYLTAPQSYKKEYADKFGTLPPDYRKYLHEREKEYQQGVSQYRNRVKWLDDAFNERKERLGSFANAQEYMQTLIAFADALDANPQQVLSNLHEVYDLNAGKEKNEAGDIPQAIAAQLNSIQSYLVAQAQAEANRNFTAFSEAKDDVGNLKYPYLEDVKPEMANMFKTGTAKTLEEAYERAIWTNPEIRAKLIEAQSKAALDNKVAEAEKAKQAGFSPSSKAESPESELSTRELLEKKFKEAGLY